jgi:hypothetical protein
MKPEACLEVASRSRKQAETYLQKGNAGRALAHFLVALNLHPSWKAELSQHFTSALCKNVTTLLARELHSYVASTQTLCQTDPCSDPIQTI